MKCRSGNVSLKPTLLAGFVECRHSVSLALGSSVRGSQSQIYGEFVQMVIDKGNLHEEQYLTLLRDDGHSVEDIDPFKEGRTRDEAIARTREAMQRGDKYIYQAALDLPGWYGIADFLEKKDLPAGEASNLGKYIYEPIDTKLARNEAKPHHALQLSVYARALEAIQGRPPEFIYIQLAREQEARSSLRSSSPTRRRRSRTLCRTAPSATSRKTVSSGSPTETICRSWRVSPEVRSRCCGRPTSPQ